MEALGRLFDVGTGWAPVDLDTANGATGKRIAMMGHRAVTFLIKLGAGGAEDVVFDIQQHTAYTGGTSNDLDSAAVADSTGVDHFWVKSETVLDNDEGWVKVTQASASECTLVGATYGALQCDVIIEVDARQMGGIYTHLSLNASITTATSRLSTCSYLPHELRYQRNPARLQNLLRPGVANA
jgi:hypothetical protein